MDRAEMLARATERREPWDMIVIGGGATGAGVALDAATRGYSVLLLERDDFGSGTSSRSTKLIHGGVRYLRQGRMRLVLDALRERGRLLRNAPHLVHSLRFVLPCYGRLGPAYYGAGLVAYDLLAGRERLGWSTLLSPRSVQHLLPTVQAQGLRGGVAYHDGQFDDARLLIHILMTAADHGAALLNHAPVAALTRGPGGRVDGVAFRDAETGAELEASARVVVNAAGPFCDDIRRMGDKNAPRLVAASQGSHVVLDRSFLPTGTALLVPETPDGRVLFAIPWNAHTLVGTTDVAIPEAVPEPRPTDVEIDFILETAGRYLAKRPLREDILSVFAGIRPLVRCEGMKTAALSRDHLIQMDAPGLLTITGGKWTTYRSMAEDCVDRAALLAGLPPRPCRTRELRLHGTPSHATADGDLAVYGSDAALIRQLIQHDPSLGEPLHPDLACRAAEVVWSARHEMARSVADVLARRLRALFLNAHAAVQMAPRVAELMGKELHWGEDKTATEVRSFVSLAERYMP